jgi:hypothetical protein
LLLQFHYILYIYLGGFYLLGSVLDGNAHKKRSFKEFCTKKMKANKTMRGQEASNHKKRKEKQSDSNIDLAVHNQILKQQKQLNGKNNHIPININTEC